MSRPADGEVDPLVPRIFAALAAFFLVAAVAFGSLLPADMDVAGAVHALDDEGLASFQHAVEAVFGRGFWHAVCVPVMVRPVWLTPLCLGIICVGGALTSNRPAAGRTKQRRS